MNIVWIMMYLQILNNLRYIIKSMVNINKYNIKLYSALFQSYLAWTLPKWININKRNCQRISNRLNHRSVHKNNIFFQSLWLKKKKHFKNVAFQLILLMKIVKPHMYNDYSFRVTYLNRLNINFAQSEVFKFVLYLPDFLLIGLMR